MGGASDSPIYEGAPGIVRDSPYGQDSDRPKQPRFAYSEQTEAELTARLNSGEITVGPDGISAVEGFPGFSEVVDVDFSPKQGGPDAA